MGTLTGVVLHFPCVHWTQGGSIALRKALPPEFMALFEPVGASGPAEQENREAKLKDSSAADSKKEVPDKSNLLRGIIWSGVQIKEDILEAFGLDIGNRFLESRFLFDTMISRGTICHHDDGRPRAGMLSLQLSLFGWERVTKVFTNVGPKTKAKTAKKSWKNEVWVEKANFKPIPKVRIEEVPQLKACLPRKRKFMDLTDKKQFFQEWINGRVPDNRTPQYMYDYKIHEGRLSDAKFYYHAHDW